MKARLVAIVMSLLAVTALAGTPSIIPIPVQMQVLPGTFTLCPTATNSSIAVHAATKILAIPATQQSAQYLAALLFKSTGQQFQVAITTNASATKGAILLTTNNSLGTLGTEGYELTVAPDSVVIRGPTDAGVFYGIQSLIQLLPPQILSPHFTNNIAWVAPCVYIQDQPRFKWRGYMMDDARHFFGKQQVKKMMDAMALHKMNTFHWHLVDDSGWRIEILAYPRLTQVGAWRNGIGTTNGPGTAQFNGINWGQNPRVSTATNGIGQYGGYYTQNDVREIVAYAAQRHITVMPEIEMPAHSSAALASYSEYGPGNSGTTYIMDINSQFNVNYPKSMFSLGTNTTLPFLRQILTEVMGLFPGQYIHCGGDEVIASTDKQWTTFVTDSNQINALGISGTANQKIIAYQHWFSTNMAAFLHNNGRSMVAWSEFEAGGIVTNAVLMDWQVGGSSFAVSAATNGQLVVLTPDVYCYMNYPMVTNNRGSSLYSPGQPYYNNASYLPLTLIYSFEPIPTNLPSQYTSNILGAECMEWSEYIPTTTNQEFKAFPRLCAMSEVVWSPAASRNYTNFTQRLVPHEQRLAAAGYNYDQTNAIVVGTWGPVVPVSPAQTNLTWDITPYITAAGDINFDFHYGTGANALNIYSTTLLINGVAADSDNTGYVGFAGASGSNLPYFTMHLPAFKPGATYTLQATVAGVGGAASSGTVYLVNWN